MESGGSTKVHSQDTFGAPAYLRAHMHPVSKLCQFWYAPHFPPVKILGSHPEQRPRIPASERKAPRRELPKAPVGLVLDIDAFSNSLPPPVSTFRSFCFKASLQLEVVFVSTALLRPEWHFDLSSPTSVR